MSQSSSSSDPIQRTRQVLSWIMLLLTVVLCKVVGVLCARWGRLAGFACSLPAAVAVAALLRPWTETPLGPAVFVGVLIPVLAAATRATERALP